MNDFIANHVLCKQLALQYLEQYVEELDSQENNAIDLRKELIQYEKNYVEGNQHSGKAWIRWFLDKAKKDYV